MAQTKKEIRQLLQAAGVRPLRQFGQNFLIDHNLMDKLVRAAEITQRDTVLEVGPGTGALTERLLEVSGHVVAVEIDRGLHQLCHDRLLVQQNQNNLTLFHRDILERKSQIAGEVLQTLADKQQQLGGRISLVANLPYQIATPLIIELILGELPVSPLCFTVQEEVAQRFSAQHDSKQYGPISIYTQAFAKIQRIARLQPDVFWPPPKVESAMLRIDVQFEQKWPAEKRNTLKQIVQGCFNHRRKTMQSNLRNILNETILHQVQQTGHWPLQQRPENLDVTQWLELADFVNQQATQNTSS